MPAQRVRRLDDAFDQPPQDENGRDNGNDPRNGGYQWHIVMIASKGDIKFARTVRKPGKAEAKGSNDDEIEQDSQHRPASY